MFAFIDDATDLMSKTLDFTTKPIILSQAFFHFKIKSAAPVCTSRLSLPAFCMRPVTSVSDFLSRFEGINLEMTGSL